MKLKTTFLAAAAIVLGLTTTPALACAPAASLECGATPAWVSGRPMRIVGLSTVDGLQGLGSVRVQLESLVDDATADAVAVVICGEYRGEPVCLLAPENFNLKRN